ncbi:hypothetical protein SY83_07150 [Paenibacillus swuensis]|uniref:Uncharacterized protein n=1 Tax=Paenibacillus swuensis TaxID=1178515 RepID=A0A172TGN2_9BACL|nr:hypothetical protein [Paenibacillus swuensis]ANE46096.1 hypothetical protein SY83_07150 [Paenibacillus swuensis]
MATRILKQITNPPVDGGYYITEANLHLMNPGNLTFNVLIRVLTGTTVRGQYLHELESVHSAKSSVVLYGIPLLYDDISFIIYTSVTGSHPLHIRLNILDVYHNEILRYTEDDFVMLG